MKKILFYLVIVIVIVISACGRVDDNNIESMETEEKNKTQIEEKSTEYKYLETEEVKNTTMIILSNMRDFEDQIEEKKVILLINDNNKNYFGYKKNETVYMINTAGYETISDYKIGKEKNYKDSKDYYHAEKIECNNSKDYYRFIKSKYLSYDDYIDAKSHNFLETNQENIELYYPIKYPDESKVQNFVDYKRQYNKVFSYNQKTNKITNSYYKADDGNYYRYIFDIDGYYHHPKFNNDNCNHGEDLYYYGKLIGLTNPNDVKKYTQKYLNKDIEKQYQNIEFKEVIIKEKNSYDIPEIRSRTADSDVKTVIIDATIIFPSIPQLERYIDDKQKEISNVLRKYFTGKKEKELEPRHENQIRADIVKSINNELGITYVEDIYFLQFNVIDF